jgi:hypothetical protein
MEWGVSIYSTRLLDKDPNPMQKEIDLAFGAKYRKVCVILLLDFFSFVFPIMMTLPCLLIYVM